MDTHFHIDIKDACSTANDTCDMELHHPLLGSSFEVPFLQNKLKIALFDNNYPLFEELVSHSAVDLEYIYNQPDQMTCLEFAVSEPNKQDFVKLLLKHKVQINNVNKTFSMAPIHFAARNGNLESLKILLEDKRIDVNITSIDETALLMVIETMKNMDDDLTRVYEDIIELLLKAGCDARSCNGCGVSPIYSAAEQGLKKVVKMIIDYAKEPIDELLEPVNGDTLILSTARGMGYYCESSKADFNWCLNFFLKKSKVNVNHRDEYNNTALHYAAINGDDETVLMLLRHGAFVGSRNKLNEPPLLDISPNAMKTYMDECITTNVGFSIRPRDEDYEIRINYGFLANTNNSLENHHCGDPLLDDFDHVNVAILSPETDALLYMSRNEELRPLLKHPVITSFLYLKWLRISCLAYANITFYSLLWLCLILYITFGYCVEEKQSNLIEGLNVVTYVGVIIGLVLLIFRELFQLLLSPVRYLKGFDNWMEIVLIGVIGWIVSHDSAPVSTKQQLSAVAILISSAELLLLVGQFPTSSTNMLMLKTVSWNFFKFLRWYCILIIAFALSFYILFREVEDQASPPQNLNNENEEGEDFFNDPFRAIFKTIVMLTGEFDAGSIQFNMFPVTSHIIFIVFVFMVPIVLFNLLNGLAVSDTQEIRANAELLGHISRIKLIWYFESILIGNAKSNNKPIVCCSWLTAHLQDLSTCISNLKAIFIKPLAKCIFLFPYSLPKYRIIVKPNQDNKIWIPIFAIHEDFGEYCGNYSNGIGCLRRYQNFKLDGKIVQNAKIVISKKKNVTEFDEIKASLLKNEAKMESLDEIKADVSNLALKYETKIENLQTKMENLDEIKANVAYITKIALNCGNKIEKFEIKIDSLDEIKANVANAALKCETKIEKLETKIDCLETTLNKVLQTLEKMSVSSGINETL